MAEPENELNVLFPERVIKLRFKKSDVEHFELHDVIVSEPKYLQGLALVRDASELFTAFDRLYCISDDPELISIGDYHQLIEDNIEDWLLIIQRLTGLTEDQIGQLSDQDGQVLTLSVLNALIPFLVRRGHLTRQLKQNVMSTKTNEQDMN